MEDEVGHADVGADTRSEQAGNPSHGGARASHAPPGGHPHDDTGIDDGTESHDGAGDRFEDGDGGAGDHVPGPDPLRFNRWMRSSASGGILTGIALGLQHALEERREQPAFVMEAPGEPEDPDAPISLHFDPDDPTKTVAVIRARSEDGRPDGSSPPVGGV